MSQPLKNKTNERFSEAGGRPGEQHGLVALVALVAWVRSMRSI